MQFLWEGSVLEEWIWRTCEGAIQHQRVQDHTLEGVREVADKLLGEVDGFFLCIEALHGRSER